MSSELFPYLFGRSSSEHVPGFIQHSFPTPLCLVEEHDEQRAFSMPFRHDKQRSVGIETDKPKKKKKNAISVSPV
jgi:hypothetical protein